MSPTGARDMPPLAYTEIFEEARRIKNQQFKIGN
jgi:hypothetical protein